MVQVDVFWSYGIGASFAAANARRIVKETREGKSAFESIAFRDTLLFLAILFAPSGVCLLWQFPSWETMHVGDRNLPGWLVTAFAVTNITQGILGYAVAQALIVRGKTYAAFLQCVLGYFLMFVILIHGWDGTGYIRFFSATPDWIPTWTPARVIDWLNSDVAITLDVMGVFLVPIMLWLMTKAMREQLARPRSTAVLSAAILVLFVIATPGTALLLSLAIRTLGPLLGIPLFAVAVYFLGLRKGGLYHRFHQFLSSEASEPLPALPAEHAARA
jgi:hypothetical protein